MVSKTELEDVIATHEKYKKSFFWNPHPNAAGRRSAEFDYKYIFEIEELKYEIHQRYEESCKNCYYSLTVYVNGDKKDIRAVKKLL